MGRQFKALKRKKYKPRKGALVRDRQGSTVLRIVVTTLVTIASVAVIVYVALPLAMPHFGIDFVPPGMSVPTPDPTPEPTPTAHPFENTDLSSLHKEVVVSMSQTGLYKWLGDPYYHNGVVVFTGGEVVNGATCMTTVLTFNIDTQETINLRLPLENTHFLYPVMNDGWFACLDASAGSGGRIIAYDRSKEGYTSPITIKPFYAEPPALFLSGDYLVWTERTGTYMDKLFVCDLTTRETTTVHMFEDTIYGMSKPYISGDTVVWAGAENEDASGQMTSLIHTLNIETGNTNAYSFDMYVHDPKISGAYIAWMDGNHGPDTSLYISRGGDTPFLVAEGVVDFFMGDYFLAYQKDETVWLYMFDAEKSFALTRQLEKAQLMNLTGTAVMWIDVTSRDRDVLKYAIIPKV